MPVPPPDAPQPPRSPPPAPWAAAVLPAVEALAVVAALGAVGLYWHDDAYITFRYAERVLAGKGLTWSGTTPVEGYTHPAWLAALAAFGALGSPVPATAKLLGAACALGTLALASRRWGSGGALALVLASFPVATWAVSGLETPAFALVGLAASLALAAPSRSAPAAPDRRSLAAPDRRSLAAGVLAGLAPWVRPEGLALGPVLAGALLLARRADDPALAAAARARSLPRLLVPAALGAAALFAVRAAVYGQLLPNTAIAKLSDEPRADVLLRGVTHVSNCVPLFVPVLVAAAIVAPARRRARPATPPDDALGACLLLAWGAAGVAIVVWEGGDHMQPLGRLLVPAAVALAGAVQAVGAAALRRSALARGALAIGALASAALTRADWVDSAGADLAWLVGRRTGLLLEAALPPGSLVATPTAGSTAYYAPDLEFIDTLGLNDPVIARAPVGELRTAWQHQPGHQRGDSAYVLSRAPDVVVMTGGRGLLGNRADAWFLTDYELIRSEAFRAAYTPYAVPMAAVVDPPGYRPGPADWAPRVERAVDPPPAVRQAMEEGREVVILWLRDDSPRCDRLRADGIDLTPLVLPVDGLLYGDAPAPP